MYNAKAVFNTKPETLDYMILPTGEADVWLRKNIVKSGSGYTAQEAYMRTTALKAEIQANFNQFFDYASTWDFREWQRQQTPPNLDDKVAVLEQQKIDIELAIVEMFEQSGEYSVCKIYADLIRHSIKTLEDVPGGLRTTVQQILYFGG